MQDLVREFVIPIAVAFGTAAIGWIFGRKQQNAQVEQSLLENTDKAIGMYKQIIDDQAQKYDVLLKKHNELLVESEKTLIELRQVRTLLKQKEEELTKPLDAVLSTTKTRTRKKS